MMDEYHGMGGSYLLNPKTGKRTLVERTEPAKPPEPQIEELSNGSDTQAVDSGKEGIDVRD
jgi:hypothetical protein